MSGLPLCRCGHLVGAHVGLGLEHCIQVDEDHRAVPYQLYGKLNLANHTTDCVPSIPR